MPASEHLERILEQLSLSPMYAIEAGRPISVHMPHAATMAEFLDVIDAELGGVTAYLASHGWTEDDNEQLRRKLLG
jgi:hypothetical protein